MSKNILRVKYLTNGVRCDVEMSEYEILRDYRHAKNKVEQVQILADMNLCSKKDVEGFLEARGVTVLKCGTPEEKRETVVFLYHQGMSDEEISTATGLKASSIGQLRYKLRLKKHKKRKPAKADLLKSSI